MAGKKRGLGRGLDALLGASSEGPESGAAEAGKQELVAAAAASLKELPIEWIKPGKYQPRQNFDDEKLDELAASIKQQGVMQPIVVRAISDQQFELIAGERRWRAAQRAGLATIPAVIQDVTDEAVIAMSLIENIQREDLNPLEESQALQRLIDEFQLTHQQVADAVGKSRTAVTNVLRLMHLNPAVARMLASGDLEMGHARALLGLEDDRQEKAAREIVGRSLNVRQAEALVRQLLSGPKKTSNKRTESADTRHLERQLSEKIGQPVTIKHSRKGKGQLLINYGSIDELEGILRHFGNLDES